MSHDGKAPKHSRTLIRHIYAILANIHRSPQGLCGVIRFTIAAEFSLHRIGSALRSSSARRDTRSVSSSRSVMRHSARPPPIANSTSGAARSVHCGRIGQIRPSSKRSNSRLPARLARLPTQTARWPEYGWNGWVTVTNCCEVMGAAAVPTELQAIGERSLHLALGQGWHGVADARTIGLSA